jgi:hypothetical protein
MEEVQLEEEKEEEKKKKEEEEEEKEEEKEEEEEDNQIVNGAEGREIKEEIEEVCVCFWPPVTDGLL